MKSKQSVKYRVDSPNMIHTHLKTVITNMSLDSLKTEQMRLDNYFIKTESNIKYFTNVKLGTFVYRN